MLTSTKDVDANYCRCVGNGLFMRVWCAVAFPIPGAPSTATRANWIWSLKHWPKTVAAKCLSSYASSIWRKLRDHGPRKNDEDDWQEGFEEGTERLAAPAPWLCLLWSAPLSSLVFRSARTVTMQKAKGNEQKGLSVAFASWPMAPPDHKIKINKK